MVRVCIILMALQLWSNKNAAQGYAGEKCIDTVTKTLLYHDGDTSFRVTQSVRQSSGKTVLRGSIKTPSTSVYTHPCLAILDKYGQFIWNKVFYTSNADSTFFLLDALEIQNGTFVVLGVYLYTNSPGKEVFTVLRLDNQGQITSTTGIETIGLLYPVTSFYPAKMCELEGGSVGIALNLASDVNQNQIIVAKLGNNDNLEWSRSFYTGDAQYDISGLVVTEDAFVLAGKMRISSGGCFDSNRRGQHLIKFNSADGKVLLEKSYCYQTPGDVSSFTGGISAVAKINSNEFRVLTDNRGDMELNQVIVASYDFSLNILSSRSIRNHAPNNMALHYSMNNRGDFVLGATNPNDLQESFYILIDSSYRIADQRKLYGDINLVKTSAFDNNLVSYNESRIMIFNTVTQASRQVVQQLSFTKHFIDSSCIGTAYNIVSVGLYPFAPSGFSFFVGDSDVLEKTDAGLTQGSLLPRYLLTCQTISKHPNFSIGPDLAVCETDSISLTMPTGNYGYQWQTDIGSQIYSYDPVITIKPVKDVKFFATMSGPGDCVMKDTVEVKVYSPTKVNIGPDTTICETSEVRLEVSAGFVKQTWSTGSNEQNIIVLSAGDYIVEAVDVNLCLTRDTISVRTITRPKNFLPKTSTICLNQNDVLRSTPSFRHYVWQNGSTASSLKVLAPGKFKLEVQDDFGCTGIDSVTISKTIESPNHMLGSDLPICEGQKIAIRANGEFEDYLWNTGIKSSAITVATPGLYSVAVKTVDGCTGVDSINVYKIDCVTSFSVPTGFTPNGDGKNDFFKPLITGELVNYKLEIFNRWGQLVFVSQVPEKAWNGSVNGGPQTLGSYIWKCEYQFANQKTNIEKGIITLIR